VKTASEIRKAYLEFFKSKEHQIVSSAPIVVKDDPTLMFTNAGMNQFKDYFLGNKVAGQKRVTNSQKCLRVSGKHNDLEEVGVDTYHHTMFEMLGNWSFGDYFKEEAIAWSWEFLTEVLGLDKDKLYVTVFEGDQAEGLPKDDEALEAWKKHISPDRILNGNKKDNFWEMGDTGPCGPCTEIHIDMRSDEEIAAVDGKTLVNEDHEQVIEVWNNVFIQFNRKKDGSLDALPDKHVDTGMGFERLVRAIQQKKSNYDTDVFMPTIHEIEKISSKKYSQSDTKADIAFRVIADHIRAVAFAIADGQLPSNTGAGYVIRRILRRAVRYYYSYLDFKQPLLHSLVPLLAKDFSDVFPELKKQEAFVQKVVLEEENGFLSTLEKGLKRMDEFLDNKENVDGQSAFELYDTYGFPLDLTKLIASEHKLNVDENGFEKCMAQQKTRSKNASSLDLDDWSRIHEGQNQFVGYDFLESKTKVLQYRKVSAKKKEFYQIVLEETPFYAESGGQVGDSGVLRLGDATIEIFDTKKENDLILHFAQKIPAKMEGEVLAQVNSSRRKEICQHHSATHLLHAALRQVLGTHVEQKGSLVNQNQLRFDFSHIQKVSVEEQREIEQIVNAKIRENIPVVIKELPKEDALKLGAMALFGEKYGDTVRVVIMDENYSVELCGGTHIGSTGELGFFKIISEGAIAAGVRRMEAISGKKSEEFVAQELANFSVIKEALKNPKDIQKSFLQLQEDKNTLQKKVESLESSIRSSKVLELLEDVKEVDGTSLLVKELQDVDGDALRKMCFSIKEKTKRPFVALLSKNNNKANVCVLIDDDLAKEKELSAKELIKTVVAPRIKGGGGGQANFASAGGQDTSNFGEIITDLIKLITNE